MAIAHGTSALSTPIVSWFQPGFDELDPVLYATTAKGVDARKLKFQPSLESPTGGRVA